MSDALVRRPFPLLLPLLAVAFAIVHLSFEHFTGGVQSHHLLARPDLPAFSNWFGLISLPLLGFGLGLRVRTLPFSNRWASIPTSMQPALLGALCYGALLAVSFEFGLSNITQILFFGLFACALAFPIYRLEYLLGFVAGMTFTFGAVLPLLIATVFVLISFVLRWVMGAIVGMWRRRQINARSG